MAKKFVHFHEQASHEQLRDREVAVANDNLSVPFRPVTSTACGPAVVGRLG